MAHAVSPPLARAAVVVAISDVGIGVELGEAVEAGLESVGVVLLGRVGEGFDPLLAVLQLLLGFAGIKLRALGVAALPGAEVQALLGAQGAVGVGAQLEAGAAQGAAVVAALVDQVAEIELGMAVAAVQLGAYLTGGVVHHPLVEAAAADFLALVAAHQTAGVPGRFMAAVHLAHDQRAVDVVVEEGDHHLFTSAWHVHATPVRAAAWLQHAQPARTQFTVLAETVPVEAYADAVEAVGEQFMAARRDHHGGLRARAGGLGVLEGAAVRRTV